MAPIKVSFAFVGSLSGQLPLSSAEQVPFGVGLLSCRQDNHLSLPFCFCPREGPIHCVGFGVSLWSSHHDLFWMQGTRVNPLSISSLVLLPGFCIKDVWRLRGLLLHFCIGFGVRVRCQNGAMVWIHFDLLMWVRLGNLVFPSL